MREHKYRYYITLHYITLHQWSEITEQADAWSRRGMIRTQQSVTDADDREVGSWQIKTYCHALTWWHAAAPEHQSRCSWSVGLSKASCTIELSTFNLKTSTSFNRQRSISQLLNLCKTITPPISGIHRIYMWVRSVSRCYRPWNSRKIRCSLFLFSVKNAKIV